jgi:hypothetical protein
VNREDRIRDLWRYGTDELVQTVIELEEKVTELKERDDFLNALEAVGVDNWEGYSTAWQIYEGEITEDEL